MPTGSIVSLLDRTGDQLRRLASRSECPEVRRGSEDLIQDLFVRLTSHPVPMGYNAEAYAVAAFKNLIKDRVRTCNRRSAREIEVMRTRPEAHAHGGEVRALRSEHRWHIKRAIRLAGLRADHRCALWAWLRGSLAEFAERRGVSRTTAGVWALRARRILRPQLEHLDF